MKKKHLLELSEIEYDLIESGRNTEKPFRTESRRYATILRSCSRHGLTEKTLTNNNPPPSQEGAKKEKIWLQ